MEHVSHKNIFHTKPYSEFGLKQKARHCRNGTAGIYFYFVLCASLCATHRFRNWNSRKVKGSTYNDFFVYSSIRLNEQRKNMFLLWMRPGYIWIHSVLCFVWPMAEIHKTFGEKCFYCLKFWHFFFKFNAQNNKIDGWCGSTWVRLVLENFYTI